jgi:hypothetical protein
LQIIENFHHGDTSTDTSNSLHSIFVSVHRVYWPINPEHFFRSANTP